MLDTAADEKTQANIRQRKSFSFIYATLLARW
jgi:hypothetical protein